MEERVFELVCEYANNPIIKKIKNRPLALVIAIQLPYTIFLPLMTFVYWNFWFAWMVLSFNS